MDFWSYIANGGLERLLIIGVATLIGYWGYRIYSKTQTPGLALIVLAAVMLFSVILTSKQHLQTMNDNLLALATLESATEPAAIPPTKVAAPLLAPSPGQPATTTDSDTAQDEDPIESVAGDPDAVAAEGETEAVAAGEDESDRIERLIPLASGQELGGRITSVRSENLTLEWSNTDTGRIIRPAQRQ